MTIGQHFRIYTGDKINTRFGLNTLRRISHQAEQLLEGIVGDGFIAGGYPRYVLLGEPAPGDIDIFCESQNAEHRIATLLATMGYVCVKDSPTARTFEPPMTPGHHLNVQLIDTGFRSSGTPQEVLAKFDFTCNQAALRVTPAGEIEVTVGTDFQRANYDKRLSICHIQNPATIVFRVAKYATKGYRLGPAEVWKIFGAWDKLNVDERQRILEADSDDQYQQHFRE